MEVGGPLRSHTANFSVDIILTGANLLVYGLYIRWKRHTAGQRGGGQTADGHCVLRYCCYLGLFDCAWDWHRPSWPVGGFVKRADPPRPSAEHIGRPPPLYPAGLLPWTTPSPSRYINALWVVGTLPPLRLHPSVRRSLCLTYVAPSLLILMMRLLFSPLLLMIIFVVLHLHYD